MYKLFVFFEKIQNAIKRRILIAFWKLKFGKRIKIGKNLYFRKRLKIIISNDGYLEIGNNCFFNNDCSINCLKCIVIGDNNLFGENVKIYDHNHCFSKGRLEKEKFKTKKIKIGDSNWFGSNVIILNKTIIGNNNVVGANTVLNQNIENYKLIKAKNEYIIENIMEVK